MTSTQFDDLVQRIDGLGWVVATLIARLELDGRLDGPDYCRSLRHRAGNRARHALPGSARLLEQMAGMLDEARQARSAS